MELDRRRLRLEQKGQSLKVYLSDNKNKNKKNKTLQRRNPGSLPGSWQESRRCKIQLPACAFLLMLWWPERAMPEIRLSRLVILPRNAKSNSLCPCSFPVQSSFAVVAERAMPETDPSSDRCPRLVILHETLQNFVSPYSRSLLFRRFSMHL